MPTLAVIPARYGSTRFPGKPLADKTGKPLIQHVVQQVHRAASIDRVVVATDDHRIFEAVTRFGGEAMMTRGDHPNGTCRIAEVVQKLGIGVSADTIIVNVQGDEPEIEPRVIDELVAGLRAKPEADMATLAAEFTADEDPADPNIVKVVVDLRGFAIYFSRSLIPFDRDKQGVCPLKHPGLYAYRRAFLLHYVTLPATPLEEAEKLEQLRALEHGHRIAVVKTTVRHHGIDTPSQYEAFVQRVRAAAD
jgi:3-deoxy-manno-octulosonate cytidylyltransferase (CMP-KDO synthetase)